MNKIFEFKEYIKGKDVTVLGIGISNLPLIRMLCALGANVTACDKKSLEALGDTACELKALGVSLHTGDGYLDELCGDIIFKTPGMRYDIPQLIDAVSRGITVTSEMEVFFELCPAEIIAVTGSDGKTTTTTLIYEMLKAQGHTCFLGGNIGAPLLDRVDQIKPEDKVVVELSSFQLHTMKKSPHIAVVTNLSPNHLDMHKSMDEYIDAKCNIFRYQTSSDKLIINGENEITASFAAKATASTYLFGRNHSYSTGIFLENDVICVSENGAVTPVLRVSDIKLPGVHNIENYMAAIGAVWGKVGIDAIRNVARNFGGVHHRLELVRELDGVRYYNSSIDSSPTRTAAALSAFSKPVIVIVGGYDKKIPFEPLGKTLTERAKAVVLMGATAEKIEAAIKAAGGTMPLYRAENMEQAISLCKNAACNGDIVVLSPACASFDKYKNFEQRGEHFTAVVNAL